MKSPTMLYKSSDNDVGYEYQVIDASEVKASLKDGWQDSPPKKVVKKAPTKKAVVKK